MLHMLNGVNIGCLLVSEEMANCKFPGWFILFFRKSRI